MNVYMIMAALIIVLALLMKGDVPQNKKYIIWSVLIMFIVYGLRDTYSVGIDNTSSYFHIFQDIGESEWAEIREGADLNARPGMVPSQLTSWMYFRASSIFMISRSLACCFSVRRPARPPAAKGAARRIPGS